MQKENSDELMLIVTAEGNASWLREKFHPSSWVRNFGEGLMSDYKSKMQTLRQVDNRVAHWLGDLGSYVKRMEKALSANHLMDLVGLLAQVNHKLKNAINDGKEVSNLSQEALQEFDEGPSGMLPDFSEELDEKLAQTQGQLSKESWDWLDRKKREWVARRFEDKEREKRRIALSKLVDITRQTVLEVQEQLEVLGKARAAGQIGAYIDGLRKISAIQKKFHAQFSPIYVKYLAPIVRRIKQREEAEKSIKEVKREPAPALEEGVADPKTESMPMPGGNSGPISSGPPTPSGSIEVDFDEPSHSGERQTMRSEQISSLRPSAPVEPLVPSLQVAAPPPVSELPPVPESVVVPSSPVVPLPPPPAEPSPKAPKAKKPRKKKEEKAASTAEQVWLKQANTKFYQELEQAAQQNNPYLLGWMLTKHAELIAEVDEDQSVELLQIAESILNG
jgi:hypothetical protein